MNELESLKFSLKEKEEKLKNFDTNIFTLNLEVQELITEISDLENQIKQMEEKNDE